jgi:uncharacterized membrane protein YGL010W
MPGPELESFSLEGAGPELAHFLAVVIEHENRVERCELMVELLAFASLPCWILAVWPRILGTVARAFVLSGWVVLAVCWIVAFVSERVWYRKRLAALASARAARQRVGPSK